MKLSSANLIALGQRELRSIGEKCDPACFAWYGCANSKPEGICAGFDLLDGETRRHLHKLLSEDDGKYVVNCMRMLQSGSNEDGLVQEILRCLPELHQETRRREGFANMIECALGVSNTPTPEETVQRASDEIEADERQSSTPIRREMGFRNMFEGSRRGTFEGDEEFKPQPETHDRDYVRLVQSGFGAMLEAMRPARTIEEPQPEPQVRLGFLRMLDSNYQEHVACRSDDKPHVVRGMGFAAMLEGARRGTE